MNCPFFREQRVKFCGLSGYRKMILLEGADTAHEVCSGPSYPKCVLFRESPTLAACSTPDRPAVCPWLHESLVQYCTAAGFRKFIPASEPRLIRCGRPAYRYCDLYRETVPLDPSDVTYDLPPGVCLPAHLSYAPNHMWMDRIGTRQCQIGIDGFLAGVIGTVDQLSFLTVGGACRPTVVLTVKGVDLRLAFPARIAITAANLYLRPEPARLTTDAYGSGWLFEGEPEEADEVERALFRGPEAASWIRDESRRLEDWLHDRVKLTDLGSRFPAGDGSRAPWLERLSPEDLLSLFNEFFLTDEIDRR